MPANHSAHSHGAFNANAASSSTSLYLPRRCWSSHHTRLEHVLASVPHRSEQWAQHLLLSDNTLNVKCSSPGCGHEGIERQYPSGQAA
eukprot:6202347-Pleurochrysis_carterae.AAC.5